MSNEENLLDFLSQMENDETGLDEAIRDYGYLLEDTDVEQAYRDLMDARTAIKRTLKRVMKDNSLNHMEHLLD